MKSNERKVKRKSCEELRKREEIGLNKKKQQNELAMKNHALNKPLSFEWKLDCCKSFAG